MQGAVKVPDKTALSAPHSPWGKGRGRRPELAGRACRDPAEGWGRQFIPAPADRARPEQTLPEDGQKPKEPPKKADPALPPALEHLRARLHQHGSYTRHGRGVGGDVLFTWPRSLGVCAFPQVMLYSNL
jgi:hypothetical protein